MMQARIRIETLVQNIKQQHEEATQKGTLDKEKIVIPPHLHDLQEADLPETQRGLVMTEIQAFRERAAKREKEKMSELPSVAPSVLPAGPKQREWGKPQGIAHSPPRQKGFGNGAQGYNRPVGFVREGNREEDGMGDRIQKTDEELEEEIKL